MSLLNRCAKLIKQGSEFFLAPAEDSRRLSLQTVYADIYRHGGPQVRRFLEEFDSDLDRVDIHDVVDSDCLDMETNNE